MCVREFTGNKQLETSRQKPATQSASLGGGRGQILSRPEHVGKLPIEVRALPALQKGLVPDATVTYYRCPARRWVQHIGACGRTPNPLIAGSNPATYARLDRKSVV